MMSILKNPNVPVDEDALEWVVEVHGLDLKSETVEGAVEELRAHFNIRLSGVPKHEWVECTHCGEFTDDDDRIEQCPFCGDWGEEVDLIGSCPLGGYEGEENGATALATPKGVMTDELSVESGLQKARATVGSNYFDIGLAFARIHEAELWKAEGYKTFRQFVTASGYDQRQVFRLMALVTRFDRRTFQELGVEKLWIISGAPGEHRDNLLTQARCGASKRSLEAEVRQLKGVDSHLNAPGGW